MNDTRIPETTLVSTIGETLSSLYNRYKITNTFWSGLWNWLHSLSEQTLSILSIALLHCAFAPAMWAYIQGVTEKLPNFEGFAIVLASLALLMLRAIISKQMILVFVHAVGFIVQLSLMTKMIL